MIHEAYGIVVSTEFTLPLVAAPSRGRPSVTISNRPVDDAGVRFAPILGVDDAEDLWIEMGWEGTRTVLRFTDVVAELVGDRIHVDPRGCTDADYVAHVILDHVLPRWLALSGDLVLHAGSVVLPAGRAVALIGDPGRGKSSMTTALGQLGWPVLGDDACRLVRRRGVWLAHPSYPGTRLLGDSRRVLVPGARSTPMTEGADKHRVPDVPLADASAALAAVIELGSESESPAMHPLTYSEATASLTLHSFFLAPQLAQLAPRAFTLSSALAADVPCLRLDFPRRWDIYPELCELLASIGRSAE